MPAPTVLKGESSNGNSPASSPASAAGWVFPQLGDQPAAQPSGPPTPTPPVQRLVIIGLISGAKGPTSLLSLTPPCPSSAGLAQRGGLEMSRAARASGQRGFPFPVFFVVVAFLFFEKLVIY